MHIVFSNWLIIYIILVYASS